MKLQKLLLGCLFVFSVQCLYSQSFNPPTAYTLKVAADYVPYEKDVIAAAKWLKKIAFDEQTEKRKLTSLFILDWVNGSPTVDVDIYPIIMDFEKKNKGMLILYMACTAQYVLENNYSKDRQAKLKAALADMMTVYKADNEISKDKKMEKLIKANEEGKIDEWLADNFKPSSN